MSLPAGTRLGSFQIVSTIGQGGMGEVYRARTVFVGGGTTEADVWMVERNK